MNTENSRVTKLLNEIKDNSHKKVVVYSLEGCPACEDLKTKFDRIGLVYENINMNGNQQMWDKLSDMGGSEYAPQVQIDEYLVKENEYDNINELIGCTLTKILNRKIAIK